MQAPAGTSLLNLQSRMVNEQSYSSFILESQLRIEAISKVHEILYESQDFINISFMEYIRRIIEEIRPFFSDAAAGITLNIAGEDFYLKTKSMIPLGLVINEIMINSFKHAFPVDVIQHCKTACTI